MIDRQEVARLTVSGGNKSYGAHQVLRDVNLTIMPGEIHGLIGPNGSGKSTLVKCIVAAEELSGGSIHLNGQDITSKSGQQRCRIGMGIKFQSSELLPSLTVRECIRLALGYKRTLGSWLKSSGEWRVQEDSLLQQIQLEANANSPSGSLSHGEQQRLELAMALAPAPDLLLLDEPTAGMSLAERSQTEPLIHAMRAEDQSILIIEHDLDFIKRFCDTITVLHDGAIVASGPTREISANPEVRRAYLGG